MSAVRKSLLLLAIVLTPTWVTANTASPDTTVEILPEELLTLAKVAEVTTAQMLSAYPALVAHRDTLLQEFSPLEELKTIKHKQRRRIKQHNALLREQLESHMTPREARRVQQLVTAVLVRTYTNSFADLSAFRTRTKRAKVGVHTNNSRASSIGIGLGTSTWADTHVLNADGTWSNPVYYPRQ